MGYYGGWAPYVSVAERRKKAEKEASKAKKSGASLSPIDPYRGAVAKTFWGKAWCDNLEAYSDYANRMRFAVEVVRAVRQRAGNDFIIIFRLSMLDLVENGGTFDETVQLAKAIEAAGATIINTGIGWHEARIPTIATPVPRGARSRCRTSAKWISAALPGP